MNDPKTITNLKKAKSHLEKIIQMIEKDEYCIDVIQQLNAVSGYIKSAKNMTLEKHLEHCFADGVKTNDKKRKQQLIDEVIQVTKIS